MTGWPRLLWSRLNAGRAVGQGGRVRDRRQPWLYLHRAGADAPTVTSICGLISGHETFWQLGQRNDGVRSAAWLKFAGEHTGQGVDRVAGRAESSGVARRLGARNAVSSSVSCLRARRAAPLHAGHSSDVGERRERRPHRPRARTADACRPARPATCLCVRASRADAEPRQPGGRAGTVPPRRTSAATCCVPGEWLSGSGNAVVRLGQAGRAGRAGRPGVSTRQLARWRVATDDAR